MLKQALHTILTISITITFCFAQGGNGKRGGIKFIENRNQWHDSTLYSAQLQSGTLDLRNNALLYYLYDKEAIRDLHFKSHEGKVYESSGEECEDELQIKRHQYLVSFINSNDDPKVSGNEPFPEYYNYFLGKDTSNWASHAKAYNSITYNGLYDGIDMRMYSVGSDLKYDLIVNPQGQIEDVSLQYTGLDDLYIFKGDLVMETSLGVVREKRPYAYQDIDGVHMPVVCNYILDCDLLSFDFPEGYNKQYSVVIDPLLIFSTYSGSNADNWGNTATPGEAGTLYSGGITNHFRGTDANNNPLFLGEFPATDGTFQTEWGGIWDVAIIKYDSSGTKMEYATYLGGSGSEVPHSMIMDHEENLVIMGSTNSIDFPTTVGAYQENFQGGTSHSTILGQVFTNGSDIFIAKLNKDGTMLKESTYFGGTENDGQNRIGGSLTRNYGDEQRGEVFINDQNDIFISSVTKSRNLFDDMSINSFGRDYNGGESDGIIVKFDHQLKKPKWGGYLGGSNDDTALAVKINQDDQVYIAGGTNSNDFPTSSGSLHQNLQGAEDGFVALVSDDGSQLLSSTYLGTSSYDQVYFMDIDQNEDVYVLGQTRGNYPISSGVYNNIGGGHFIQKLSPDLSSSIFSTTFGTPNRNEPNISLTAFLVSECDNMYITGWGNTQPNFDGSSGYMNLDTRGLPVTSDAIRTTTTGDDFYLMVLDTDATELLYATYFGGASALVHVDGGTSRFDKRGIVYHSVCASCDGSSSFPTTEGSWSSLNGSGTGCNNAAFKFDLASLRARIQTNLIDFSEPGVTMVCFPEPIVFENVSIGGVDFIWDFGDGTVTSKLDTSHVIHEYSSPGRYVVLLTAIDENTCIGIDVAKVTIDTFESAFSVADNPDLCQGEEFRLEAFGGTDYFWYNSDSSFQSFEQFPLVVPDDTIKYYVSISDVSTNCQHFDSISVNVIPAVVVDFELKRNYDCTQEPEIEFINRTENASEYIWTLGDGSTSDEKTPIHRYDSGVFQVTLRAQFEICNDEKTITINTAPIKSYNVITPGVLDGANDVFIVQSPFPVGLTIFNRWGRSVFEAEDYQNNWDASGQSPGVYYYNLSIGGEQICKGWVQVLK